MTLDDTTDTIYVVSDVEKKEKRHMSLVDDNPDWTIIDKEVEKYRLVVREVETNIIGEYNKEIQVFVKSFGYI